MEQVEHSVQDVLYDKVYSIRVCIFAVWLVILIKLLNSKKIVYVLMVVVIFLMAFEYIAAKAALESILPLTLIFLKYIIGIVIIVIVKIVIGWSFPLKKRDIPILLLCSLFGTIIYYGSEYKAMSYLPISIITIILTFTPCVSVVIEIFLYKRKPSLLTVIGVLASVIGVGMVVGADFSELFQGRYIGYLFAFAAVICWNIYNFITKDLSKKYSFLDVTFFQILAVIVMLFPYAITNLPDIEMLDSNIIGGVLYLGIFSAFLGAVLYVNAVKVIGPTPSALFSNFLPIVTTFLGWIILNEHISGIQLLGGAIVIISGAVVIQQKGKEE